MVALPTTLLSLFLARLAATTPVPATENNITTTFASAGSPPPLLTSPPPPSPRLTPPQAITLSCYTPSGTLSFSEYTLRRNLAAFPDSSGASGFPHHYANFESFFWDFNKAACDAAPVLLEMPVFENGRLYGWDTAPRPYPGPVRLVYEADGSDRTFCGLIVHAAGTGAFVKCVVA